MDVGHINLISGLVTCNPRKNKQEKKFINGLVIGQAEHFPFIFRPELSKFLCCFIQQFTQELYQKLIRQVLNCTNDIENAVKQHQNGSKQHIKKMGTEASHTIFFSCSLSEKIGYKRPTLDPFDGLCNRRGSGVVWLELVW